MMMMTIYVVVAQLNLLWSNPCQEGHSHRADGFEEDRPFNNNIIINNQLLLHFINVDFVFYCESFAYHDGGQDGEDVPDDDDEDVDGWMDGYADNL